MIIGITDTLNKKFDYYNSWLRKIAPEAETIKLSHESGNARTLATCDGIIFTGGGDIHPALYGRNDLLNLTNDVNRKRDEFECTLVREAIDQRVPVLGVCRGMQIWNVALGGSMIPDVEKEGYKHHGKGKGGKDTSHGVQIEKGSLLHWIVESTKGTVNSAHHQGVDVIGKGLKVSAKSPDGVIEGLEWESEKGKPFLQLVQWHPERMEDFDNPCSKNLLEHFVLAVVSRAED